MSHWSYKSYLVGGRQMCGTRIGPITQRTLLKKRARNLNDLCIQLLRRKLTKEEKKCRFLELRFVALA